MPRKKKEEINIEYQGEDAKLAELTPEEKAHIRSADEARAQRDEELAAAGQLRTPVATVEQRSPHIPTVEMSVESGSIRARVFPQIRVGLCAFHGAKIGKVDLNTLRGICRHDCKTDPYCPHKSVGCENYEDPITHQPAINPGEDYCRHNHHYEGVEMRCSYCPMDQDHRAVIKERTLFIYQSPTNPNQMIVVCSDFKCQDKHQKRFRQGV